LVGKPEGKRPLGRLRHRWEDTIEIDLNRNRVGTCGLDASRSEQGPMSGSSAHGNELSDSVKGEKFLD
jgi:hypothetical protein